MRQPLVERINGGWSTFEAQLFNLVTRETHRMETDGDLPAFKLLFSKRLALTQVLLDQFDEYLRGVLQ